MTHDELLAKINEECATTYEDANGNVPMSSKALRAVVELHKPVPLEFVELIVCKQCACEIGEDYDYDIYFQTYPCSTIQAIEKEFANNG